MATARSLTTPSIGSAVGSGLRALWREPWLVPAAALVGAARRAATWPAWAVLWTVVARAALLAFRERRLDVAAPLEGGLAALLSPRLLALAAGLWLAGALLGAALRVAWLAGALPTLGAAMAGTARAPRFAPGVAYAFPRVLGAAALGLALDVAAALFAWTLALAVLTIVLGRRGSALLAAAAALALTLALLVPLAAGALADAAVARAAIRQEGPGTAFAMGALRLGARPGSFVLAALAFAAAAVVVPLAVEGFGGVATGFARDAGLLVLLGPHLMIAAAALLLGAAVDLWRLGTFAALACGGEDRPRSP